MPLSQDTITDIIRWLKYDIRGLYQISPAGGSTAVGNMGFRYFGAYGQLLFRVNFLLPNEEAKITGQPTGWIVFAGQNPNPGDSVTVTLTAAGGISIPISVVVPAQITGQPPYTLLNLAQAFASAFSANLVFQSNGFQAVADYGQNPLSQQTIAAPICSLLAPTTIPTFNLAVTWTGTVAPYVTPVARPVSPYISWLQAGQAQSVYGYIPILNTLDAAYGGEVANLTIFSANGAQFRPDVLDRREQQIDRYRKMLSEFTGIDINPCLPSERGGGPRVCF